ncbi:MAG: protein-tyrosine-phosphatase [Candidatus Muproteobacteria bacterium RBG_16_64_10]|uniref:Protein-tyrosine-phosphatase n=1 Tax=Candidatus Muproteobacteria bacterium RBG_16_64_10 TaxID=1817757 RepID=A0A1F6SZQ5_9PROT|nr:MAG: protein-tyrosine-phosphatase [Candidatus Muproteobacteria bacterium RBG_16_64_10]
MNEKIYNVLFLCTGNSARSILAEVLLNHLGKGRFRAFSAGSHPAGQVNPLALELLRKRGLPVDRLRSKNWDEYAQPGAPAMEFVITVCDKAAGEQCPFWPGQPMTAHWGFEDPAAAPGSDEARRKVFEKIFIEIARRIELLLALPVEKLDRLALERKVREIGGTRS